MTTFHVFLSTCHYNTFILQDSNVLMLVVNPDYDLFSDLYSTLLTLFIDICLLVCDVVKTTVAGAASWSYAGVDSHYEICR